MSYSRVPEQFLQDIILQPHNFNDPENTIHAQYVNLQLREQLYSDATSQISQIQFDLLDDKKKCETIKISKITKCFGLDPFKGYCTSMKQFLGKIPTIDSNSMYSQIISCQDWLVQYYSNYQYEYQSTYRVKIHQTSSDIFKAEIIPYTFWKVIKDLFIN